MFRKFRGLVHSFNVHYGNYNSPLERNPLYRLSIYRSIYCSCSKATHFSPKSQLQLRVILQYTFHVFCKFWPALQSIRQVEHISIFSLPKRIIHVRIDKNLMWTYLFKPETIWQTFMNSRLPPLWLAGNAVWRNICYAQLVLQEPSRLSPPKSYKPSCTMHWPINTSCKRT